MLLIIDDDWETRKEILIEWWKKRNYNINENNIISLLSIPKEGLSNYLMNHSEIIYISLDHDLGNEEVSKELNKDAWLTPSMFKSAWKNKTVIIHSMNSVGAINIHNKLSGIAEQVNIIPLSLMT